MRRTIFAFFCVSSSLFGNAVLITNPQGLSNTDVVDWSQFLPDQVNLGPMFNGGSTYNDSVFGQLSNSAGSATIMIAGQNFAAKGGFQANDALVSTDSGTAPGGTLTLSFTPQFGGGTYIEGEGGKQFTARIQAFAGFSSVLDTTVTSDAAGDPIFLGAEDTSSDITKIVYSLTANAGGSLGDFVIDRFMVGNVYVGPLDPPPPLAPAPAGVPEPGFSVLVGFALLFIGWKAFKPSTCC